MNEQENPPITRETGLIYAAMLDQAREMREENEDPAYIAEFCISCMETVLCEGIASQDRSIRRLLMPYFKLVNVARDKYDQSRQNKEDWMYINNRLEDIAEMVKSGKTQKQIAEELDIAQSSVCRRIRIIKEKYPELL